MKHLTPLFLILLLVFASCGEQKKSDIDQLLDTVMAGHDEIMPKMGDIMKYKKQLKEKISLLTKESIEANADNIAKLNKAIEDLDNSHEEMMNWMHGFDRNFEGMVNEEVIKYLNTQKEKIETVGEMTNSALKNAEELLSE